MNYEIYRNLARQKLREYGTTCILQTDTRKYSKEEHDYVITSVKIKGVGLVKNYSLKDIDGEIIRQGDVSILFQKDVNIAERPEVDSYVIFGDEKYKVVNVRKIAPNGVDVVLYELQGRQ